MTNGEMLGTILSVKRSNIILHNILQELFDKTFDCNYDEFHKYITLEIGITEDEIEELRNEERYVFDINGKQL